MSNISIALLASLTLLTSICATANEPAAAPMSDRQVIDSLVKQNQMLLAENARLSERPQTKEEAFAICMQAAKGPKSAMAAESIGEHCDRLLKQSACVPGKTGK